MTAPAPETTDDDVRPHLRHNVVALGLDFGLFLVGFSFAGQATILPAFAAHLGAPNVVIGAIPALMTVGWYLPPLFVAGHTESLSQQAARSSCATPSGSVRPISCSPRSPSPSRRGRRASPSPSSSRCCSSWRGRAASSCPPGWTWSAVRSPPRLRGRFFAVASMGAGVAGLGAGLVTAWLLSAVPAPRSYGICFLLAALFLALSYVALASVREPAGPAGRALTLGPASSPARPRARARQPQPRLVPRRARLASVGTAAGGFYTVYALTVLGAPAWQAGVFTTPSSWASSRATPCSGGWRTMPAIAPSSSWGWRRRCVGNVLALTAGRRRP